MGWYWLKCCNRSRRRTNPAGGRLGTLCHMCTSSLDLALLKHMVGSAQSLPHYNQTICAGNLSAPRNWADWYSYVKKRRESPVLLFLHIWIYRLTSFNIFLCVYACRWIYVFVNMCAFFFNTRWIWKPAILCILLGWNYSQEQYGPWPGASEADYHSCDSLWQPQWS